MAPKSDFESFFRRAREALNIDSQNELALLLRVNRSAITQAKRKDAVPEAWITRLSRSHGINPVWLESGRGDRQLTASDADGLSRGITEIPKYRARISAGGGSFEMDQRIENYYFFRTDWITTKGNPHRMILLDIFGNSMEPELKDGDSVLIDQSQKDILAGAIYAIGVEDVIMVKRVEKLPNKLVLHSDNKSYTPVYIDSDEIEKVRIIGKVIWVGREFT